MQHRFWYDVYAGKGKAYSGTENNLRLYRQKEEMMMDKSLANGHTEQESETNIREGEPSWITAWIEKGLMDETIWFALDELRI